MQHAEALTALVAAAVWQQTLHFKEIQAVPFEEFLSSAGKTHLGNKIILVSQSN